MDKNYIASWCKKVEFDNGGHIYNIRIKVEDLVAIEKDGWAKVTMSQRREESETGATHFMYEDTYEPKNKQTLHPADYGKSIPQHPADDRAPTKPDPDEDDDLPF